MSQTPRTQGSVLIVSNTTACSIGAGLLTSQMKTLFKTWQADVPLESKQLLAAVFQATSTVRAKYSKDMIVLTFLFALLWDRAPGWGFKDGVLHNSIWLERAAGVYHREGRAGKYQLTYAEAKAVCEYEGGHLATYQQLEAARKIGFHMCAAGWLAKGRVGYPIVKPGSNCGFGKTGIVDYGFRLNRSEKWDAYCYNPNGKDCGGVFTAPEHIFKTPGYPDEYEDDQTCYWHIRVKYGQRIKIQFLTFDLEDDTACMADYLEIYDSYDDVNGFVGRYCGDELPEDIISTGNVMTLKFLSDASITAGGFKIKYIALDPPKKSAGKNTTQDTNYFAGRYGIV